MYIFLKQLWKSPLIRLASIWFVIAILGIGVFGWKLSELRSDLFTSENKVQSYISALQQVETPPSDPESDLERIIDEIEKYRPSVEQLLGFLEKVEDLADQHEIFLYLHTLNDNGGDPNKEKGDIRYKAGFRSSAEKIQSFISDFEKLSYATSIESIDITREEQDSFVLRLIFTLHTKLT